MARMTCKLSLLVVLSFALAFSPACADGISLLKQCQEAQRLVDGVPSKIDRTSVGFCLGMVQGVRDTMAVYWELLYQMGAFAADVPRICWPKELSNEQSIRIVIKYLKDHPNELHESDHALVMRAFLKAFPCK